MRGLVVWVLGIAAVLAVVAVAGALLVDAPIPGGSTEPAAVDCGDDEAVARADAEAARQASLGLRTTDHDCG